MPSFRTQFESTPLSFPVQDQVTSARTMIAYSDVYISGPEMSTHEYFPNLFHILSKFIQRRWYQTISLENDHWQTLSACLSLGIFELCLSSGHHAQKLLKKAIEGCKWKIMTRRVSINTGRFWVCGSRCGARPMARFTLRCSNVCNTDSV